MNKNSSQKLDYGLDAPGLVKYFLIGVVGAVVIGILVNSQEYNVLLRGLAQMGAAFAASGFLMIVYSYYGKFRSRDALIRSIRLIGNETVLDLGCGRGLLLIGAAKALSTGKAIGIDLWSQADLSSNRREATIENAKIEGVEDRIEVIDGDMQELPLADASVDVVIASMSIHNIPSKRGREEAIREAVRVLKPGGKIALLDFKSTALYASVAKSVGLKNVRRPVSPWCFPPSRIVYGVKPLN
jgi:SAM-dependent methyltransferase